MGKGLIKNVKNVSKGENALQCWVFAKAGRGKKVNRLFTLCCVDLKRLSYGVQFLPNEATKTLWVTPKAITQFK